MTFMEELAESRANSVSTCKHRYVRRWKHVNNRYKHWSSHFGMKPSRADLAITILLRSSLEMKRTEDE